MKKWKVWRHMIFTPPPPVTNCHTFSDPLPPSGAWHTLWTAPTKFICTFLGNNNCANVCVCFHEYHSYYSHGFVAWLPWHFQFFHFRSAGKHQSAKGHPEMKRIKLRFQQPLNKSILVNRLRGRFLKPHMTGTHTYLFDSKNVCWNFAGICIDRISGFLQF